MELPAAYQQLVNALDQLPAVGPRAAARLAQHLLNEGQESLLQALTRSVAEVVHCDECQSFSNTPVCACCADANRDRSALLIVATVDEQLAAEAAGWRGLYFVLHGLLSPMAGRGPRQLGIHILQKRLQHSAIKRLCIALEASAEGKATAQFIRHLSEAVEKQVECFVWSEWLQQQEQSN